MTDEALWARRVAEWKASGEPSTTFVAGREFSASALRYWAKRLERADRRPVRLARLVRGGLVPEGGGSAGIALEVGGVRVLVAREFDRDALRTVLEVLGELAAR